ncbi:hypothetical protein HV782_010985 [Pseudomonas monsensis]|nr:hypothetical protein HV782_010985 [Pseudomonas monsensis]
MRGLNTGNKPLFQAQRGLWAGHDDFYAGVHPERTVGALTLMGPKGEVTVFGLGTKCDDLQCLGAMRLGEQKLIDVLLDGGEG